MKNLVISLALVLFTSLSAFAQEPTTFHSNKYVISIGDIEKVFEENTVITINEGVIVINPDDPNDEHVNLLINGEGEEVENENSFTAFFNAIDKSCNHIVVSMTYLYDKEAFVIGFVDDNMSIFYLGDFEK